MRLHDKIALITGASSGMGHATAATFAREGATVLVADINDDDGTAAVKEIQAAGGQARYLHLDVTDESAWTVGIDEVLAEFGRLDVLVNNAGALIRRTPIAEYDDAYVDAVLDLNVRQVVRYLESQLQR